jgi:hypothetical protein
MMTARTAIKSDFLLALHEPDRGGRRAIGDGLEPRRPLEQRHGLLIPHFGKRVWFAPPDVAHGNPRMFARIPEVQRHLILTKRGQRNVLIE